MKKLFLIFVSKWCSVIRFRYFKVRNNCEIFIYREKKLSRM